MTKLEMVKKLRKAGWVITHGSKHDLATNPAMPGGGCMKYVYPVIITLENGQFLASAPDLPGLHTFGADLADALEMAQDALAMWLWDAENKGEPIPAASSRKNIEKMCKTTEQFVNLIAADTDEYRRQVDTHAIKKTLSIPAWLNNLAEKSNAPFSQILQQGLKEYLHVTG